MKKKIIKKPFDLEAYKKGAKIQTRDGHEVRIVCTNVENPRFPIIALAKLYNEEEVVVHYTLEGKALLADTIHQNDIVIVEEVKSPEYWSDNKNNTFSGFYVNGGAGISKIPKTLNIKANYNVFATEKQAKSALAMARISQILANDVEHFGGVITDEEWKDNYESKFVIYRLHNNISVKAVRSDYHFLAFHTAAQRNLFLEIYYDLVKEYLMIY